MFAAQSADGLTAFAVCHLCDATGVDDADVRHFAAASGFHACTLHLLRDSTRLGKIQLAAKRIIDRFLRFKDIHGCKDTKIGLYIVLRYTLFIIC
jgi:hypothetical protein